MDNDNKPMNDDELLDLLERLPEGDAALWKKAGQQGCLEDLQDLRLLAAASRAEREGLDVEERLAAFHAARRRKKKLRMRRWTLALTGVAAALAAFLLWAVPYGISLGRHSEPVVVFLSDSTAARDAVLKTEAPPNVADTYVKQRKKRWTMSAPNEIDYHTRQDMVANARDLPEKHSLTVPRGQTFKIILSDGTEVYMNTDSRLVYPDHFTGAERSVFLEGEAYFKVARDEHHPFIVRTRSLQTRVLGTEFNVSSYPGSEVQVTLIEGSVEVSDADRQATTRIVPGEQASLLADGDIAVQKVDVSSYVHWKEGYFYYDNVPLLDIMKDLGRWYNVSVVFCNAEALDCRLHYVADRREDLQHAVTLLNRMQKFKVTLKDDHCLYVE